MDQRMASMLLAACMAAIGAWATAVGAQTPSPVSIWSGVYTAAQGQRGAELHSDVCAMCHGPRLNGAGQAEMPPSPAIAGTGFLRKWSGRNLAALFMLVRHTMPTDSPGTLTDQQAADAIAHMLAVSGVPAGAQEMPPDPKALGAIVIDANRP